jgi:hypothetical protein
LFSISLIILIELNARQKKEALIASIIVVIYPSINSNE